MATLKEDSSSYRASGVMVRDARHTHNGPSEPAHRSTKDKRRWCRGKVGIPHKLVVSVELRKYGFPRLSRHCSECGKEFDSYGGYFGKPPEWASPEDLKALEQAKHKPRPEIRRR
jgi:hypothetical protein